MSGFLKLFMGFDINYFLNSMVLTKKNYVDCGKIRKNAGKHQWKNLKLFMLFNQ